MATFRILDTPQPLTAQLIAELFKAAGFLFKEREAEEDILVFGICSGHIAYIEETEWSEIQVIATSEHISLVEEILGEYAAQVDAILSVD